MNRNAYLNRAGGMQRMRGATTLIMSLFILIAMSIITMSGAHIAITKHRITANSTHAERAFHAAEAGIATTTAYLQANKPLITSNASGGWLHAGSNPRWQACDPSATALPCGDGDSNLYGADWMVYGPVPNLVQVTGDYQYQTWLLSDNLLDTAPSSPFLGCLNLGLTALLPPVTATLVDTVNSLLGLILPGLGLPSDLCLPLNFSDSTMELPPSKVNPTITILSEASHATDVMGGRARAQQTLAVASRFVWPPMAALTVNGTLNMHNDIRIWGNPRPPTVAPYDWSILNLNDIAGLDISDMIELHMQGGHAASLAPLLNLTTAEVLALDWNVTFPLSIWSHHNAVLHSGPVGSDILSGARTCSPAYGGSPSSACLPLSYSVEIPAGSIALLTPLVDVELPLYLPDVQDEENFVNAASGLLDTTDPVEFPDDLLLHTFGVASDDILKLKQEATVVSNCNGMDTSTTGMLWVEGNCTLSGNVGSAGTPPLLLVDGNISLADGALFQGVIYQIGPSARNLEGPNNPATRPVLQGAFLLDNHLNGSGKYNVIYDGDIVRAVGYSTGTLTALPGSWSDSHAGP